jgi:hypothetical protein
VLIADVKHLLWILESVMLMVLGGALTTPKNCGKNCHDQVESKLKIQVLIGITLKQQQVLVHVLNAVNIIPNLTSLQERG